MTDAFVAIKVFKEVFPLFVPLNFGIAANNCGFGEITETTEDTVVLAGTLEEFWDNILSSITS